MATTKKKTTKKSEKRFLSGKEYDGIVNSFYTLRRKIYKLATSGKLYPDVEKTLMGCVRKLDKAKMDTNWARATNYIRP